MKKGFPQTPEEYQRVSKMRPETMEDFELMNQNRYAHNTSDTNQPIMEELYQDFVQPSKPATNKEK